MEDLQNTSHIKLRGPYSSTSVRETLRIAVRFSFRNRAARRLATIRENALTGFIYCWFLNATRGRM